MSLPSRLDALQDEIEEREVLLKKLSKDHWLYDMQKQMLDDKRKEYTVLLDVYERSLRGEE